MDLKKSGKPIVALSGKKHKCTECSIQFQRLQTSKANVKIFRGFMFSIAKALNYKYTNSHVKKVYYIRVGKNPSITYSIHSQTILTMAHLSGTRDPT